MDQAVLNELLTICWRIARNVTTITVADLEKLREVLEKIERRGKQRGSFH